MDEQISALSRQVRLLRCGLIVIVLLFVGVAAQQQGGKKIQAESIDLIDAQGKVVGNLSANGLVYKLEDGTQAGFGLVDGRPVIRMEDKMENQTMITTAGLLMSGGTAKASIQPNRIIVSEGNAKSTIAIQRSQGQMTTTDADGDLNWSSPIE